MRFVGSVIVFAIFFALLFEMLGQGPAAQNRNRIKRLDGSTISAMEIEQAVTRLMQAARVTGLGVAILNENEVAYVKSFGYRNKEAGQP